MVSRNSIKRVMGMIACMFVVLLASVAVHSDGVADAEALFKTKCAMCHGADATGKTPMGAKLNIPDLRSPAVQNLPLSDVTAIIAKGKNRMPGYEGKLTAEQISQLATYVRGLKK